MKTLCMDSAHKHLMIVLLEDGEVRASSILECWKRQSETLFPELIKCIDTIGWTSEDIDEVMITDGPGSYTGVRIAMSVAKVLCTQKHLPLYCISTLQLYAGLQENAFVVMDARSNRAYVGRFSKGILQEPESIWSIDRIKAEVNAHDWHLYGDLDFIEKNGESVDFPNNFKDLRPLARRIENIHILTPHYLKEQEAYKVK